MPDVTPQAVSDPPRHQYGFLRWVATGLAVAGGACWLVALFTLEVDRKNALLVAAGLIVAAALATAIIQYRLWNRATHGRFTAERAAAEQEWEALLRDERGK